MGLFFKKKKEEKKDIVEKTGNVKIEKKKKESPEVSLGSRSGIGKDVKIKKIKFVYQNLVHPLMTEKVSGLGMQNQYVFEVVPNTNKVEVKKAIQNVYNVKVEKVNMLNVRGRSVRYGRNYGKTKNWKKAIVTLKQGEKIEIYEGV